MLGGMECGDVVGPCDRSTGPGDYCEGPTWVHLPSHVAHCGCPEGEECLGGFCLPKVALTNLHFSGDSSNGSPSGSVNMVSCNSTSVSAQVNLTFDPNLVPALAGQTTFNWNVTAGAPGTSGSMTLSTMDGTPIYQNTTDILFIVNPEAAFPTPQGDLCAQSAQTMCTSAIVMTSADPTKFFGTVTGSGGYVCPDTMHPTDDAGTGPYDMAGKSPYDMAASGPPPVITNVPDPVGYPGTQIEIDGTNLADFTGMEKVTFGGVPITQPIDYGGFGGLGVGVIVPDGAPNGPIVWTNKNGSSTWPGPFHVEYTPVIASASPLNGPSGTVVDFTGTHLDNIDPSQGGYVDSGGVDGMGHMFAVTNISATTARITIPAITPSNGNSCTVTLSLHNIPPGGMSTAAESFLLTGAAPNCP
jgi:hypothetical protein